MSAAKRFFLLRLWAGLWILGLAISGLTYAPRAAEAQTTPGASVTKSKPITDKANTAFPKAGTPKSATGPTNKDAPSTNATRTGKTLRNSKPNRDSAGANTPYLLGTGDIIKVSFFKNPDISGQFAVRQDGTVSVPLLGAVKVAGKSVAEAETTLADRLSVLSKRTSYASVEVSKYRPIYVVGFVQRSGSYPWAPNLNVLQAVSLAGGFRRAGDFVAADSDREAGQLTEASELLARALVRRARLLSEREGKTEFDVPERLEGLVSRIKTHGIIDTEKRMLRRGVKIRAATKENRKRLLELAEEEVKAVETRLVAVRSQKKVKGKMVEKLRKLYKRGNTTFNNLNDTESEVARLEGEEGDLLAALARARQRYSSAQHDVQRDDTEVLQEIERKLADVEQDIARYTSEVTTSKRVLKRYGARVCPTGSRAGEPSVSYQIVRESGAKSETLNVNERAPVRPGDTLRVRELAQTCANG